MTATIHSQHPLVTISILNWNGWEDTLECLEAVRKLDYPNYLTVVVDNGSTNGSAKRIRAWADESLGPGAVIADYSCEQAARGGEPDAESAMEPIPPRSRMVIVRVEENLGFPGGHNVAVHYALRRRAAADYVLLLNNDATAPPDVLCALVSAAEASGAGVVGALVTDSSGRRPEHPGIASLTGLLFRPLARPHIPYPSTDANFWEAPFVHGAGMLVAARVLQDVSGRRPGYLNSEYFLYHEEFEFLFHARALGHRAVIAPKATLPHRRGKSSNIVVCTYYTYRNAVALSKLALSRPRRALFNALTLAALPARLLRLLWRGRPDLARAVFEGQRDGYLGRMGKWKRHDEVVLAWRESNRSSQRTPQPAARTR